MNAAAEFFEQHAHGGAAPGAALIVVADDL